MEIESAAKLIKSVLPTYEVKEVIGEGSFGAVFRIKDELKERAAKIILLSASPTIEGGKVVSAEVKIERDFRHIVENYERIKCDEIVSVYDFYKVIGGEDTRKETAYAIVVMELYPSNLLLYLVDYFKKNNRSLPVETAQLIIEKLAQLLGNLYIKRGFLFEDLKPDNILIKDLGSDVKIVVGDIGGLKNLGSASTTSSQVTLSYCAAEVLRRGQKPDLRSIIYSYGLISYLILEGHLPYETHGINDRIELIKEKGLLFEREDIPEQLKKIIGKCVAFSPENRYSDFNEIIDALHGKTYRERNMFSEETIKLGSLKNETEAPSRPPVEPRQSFYRTILPGDARLGMTGSLSQLITAEKKRAVSVRLYDNQDAIDKVDKEIRDFVVRGGDVYKIQGESLKVYGDIIVERKALLIIEDATLYFDEDSGIVSFGTIRATGSSFSAIDYAKKWNNIVLNPQGTRITSIKDCKISFGKGRTWKSLKTFFGDRTYPLNDEYHYGGGLFIVDITEKNISIHNCTISKCSAHSGGAIFCLNAEPAIENSVFQNCFALLSGGGFACHRLNPVIRNCRFLNCSSKKEGGGMFCSQSHPIVENCMFQNCSTSYLYGGGIYCSQANPQLKGCKFNTCTAVKDGGAVYCDIKSHPRILYPQFTNCKPSNTNCALQ
jgi:serine/threonine protein kinase